MFYIKSESILSVIIVIALCCSGLAFGIHYTLNNQNMQVKILANHSTAIEGDVIHLESEVIGGEGPFSYSWFVNSTFYSYKDYLNITFYNPGIHVVSLTVTTKYGHYSSDIIIMHVLSSPDIFIWANRTSLNQGQSVMFNSSISGGMGPYYYTWFVNGHVLVRGFNMSKIKYRFSSHGTYDVGLDVNNSMGYFGTTTFNFNPWGFSVNSKPAVRQGYPENTAMANVQSRNASGVLTFHFYLYNPSSSDGSNNITVFLYQTLPPDGPKSPPITNFTFSSGLINAENGTWITVSQNIDWNYSTIVVIPQTQTGTGGNEIGVANPAQFNLIFSHYWAPPWNGADDGFVGFWTISHNITLKVG